VYQYATLYILQLTPFPKIQGGERKHNKAYWNRGSVNNDDINSSEFGALKGATDSTLSPATASSLSLAPT